MDLPVTVMAFLTILSVHTDTSSCTFSRHLYKF